MKSQSFIASQIIELIQVEKIPVGTHLSAQKVADRLRVSRSPVNEALQHLCEKGFLVHQKNKGYYTAQVFKTPGSASAASAKLEDSNLLEQIYFQIAEDYLQGALSFSFTESLIRTRYGLTASQTHMVLSRIANEGWAQRKPGYGWEFSKMMLSPDTLLQSYRLRLALEPAALLEPGFRLDPDILERCRETELWLLKGAIKSASIIELHDRGIRFHESLVEASGNPFFIDTIKRVNKVRRLLSYRSMKDRSRYKQQSEQHLSILEMLKTGQNKKAALALKAHLQTTLKNLEDIKDMLGNAQQKKQKEH